MNNPLLILLACLFFAPQSFTQDYERQNYHSPLGIPHVLASNFGELRPNHFHMGVDFKTNGRIGYNLYAVEDGYVSKIHVSPYGYGKVIYIDHPNGVTSVYAHCSEFKGQLDSIVRHTQQEQQNFEVEIFPKKNELNVTKGQVIAISGNTGGSTAPHLHFELRDTETESALNPLIYGFDIADSRKPEIRGVKIYSLTKDGYRFNKSIKRQTLKTGNSYTVSNNAITIPADFLTKSGGIGFAFDVIDRLDAANNSCGLYGSYLLVNGDTLFGQEINHIPFQSTRFVNSHTDYDEYALNRKKFHKSFRTTENTLPIYTVEDLGVLKAKAGDHIKVSYVAYDAQGNTSVLNFTLRIKGGEICQTDSIVTDLSYLQPSTSMRVEQNNTSVDFGVCTTYEPLSIDGTHIESKIGDPNVPVQNPYRINIIHDGLKDGKHYIEMITEKERKKAISVTYEDNLITCEPKYFGTYKVKRDTTPPTIKALNVGNSSTQKRLSWEIYDEESGLKDYDLFIDGQWYLIEYDYKTKRITFVRERSLVGPLKLELIILDNCGNSTTWKKTAVFK
ncbi:MAG: M23 family metallopeptidase [Crocinitomicaceae bacterium]|nr:M23 family metallopeptidase [Crocinitomicaceae bacterium]